MMNFTFSSLRKLVAAQSVALLLGSLQTISAQSTVCSVANDFSAAISIGATPSTSVWGVDRKAPNAFTSQVNFAGDSRLKHSINSADYDGTTNYNNTQGRSLILPDGVVSMEIDVYIPGEWETSGSRMAGLWGVGYNSGSTITSYPIVEFTSEGGTARFRGYDPVGNVNGWIDMGLPAGFTYNSWVKLRMEVLPSGEIRYSAGNLQATTTAFTGSGTTRLGIAILQGYNANVSYDIYWDNFCAGTVGSTPSALNLTVSVPLGSTPNCTAVLTATGNGTKFVFTGPNGYVYTYVYRDFGSRIISAVGVKEPGTYTLTVYGPAGDLITQNVNVTGQACQ